MCGNVSSRPLGPTLPFHRREAQEMGASESTCMRINPSADVSGFPLLSCECVHSKRSNFIFERIQSDLVRM